MGDGHVGGHQEHVREFFDTQYRRHRRYWWRGDNRYSLQVEHHTRFNGLVLSRAKGCQIGRVLDVGAGEGSESIRLAMLGYEVDALDISAVGCEKIEYFARKAGVRINVRNESILDVVLNENAYDLVVMNGVLHYIEDKSAILENVRRASTGRAVHVISLFSAFMPSPQLHGGIPMFPDQEDGLIREAYRSDDVRVLMYERGKPEYSHPGFPPHAHSHIKMIVELSNVGETP